MVIDTEVHVIYRLYLHDIHPERSLIETCSLHAHDGDVLVAEMDRARVDQGFLISYTPEDVTGFLRRNDMGLEDFVTGKRYTRFYCRKYADRFYWFASLSDPRTEESLQIMKADSEAGAVGFKIFPGLLNIHLNHPAMIRALESVRVLGGLVMIGPEETSPPDTPSLRELLEELDELLEHFRDIRFQLNHAGCVDPLKPEGEIVIRMARKHSNLFLSTAILGYKYDDEHEYPFPNQLKRLQKLYDAVGIEPLLFATDWPWTDHVRKYVQDVDAVRRHADFMNEKEKQAFLGLNALRFLGHHARPRTTPSSPSVAGWAQGSEQDG